MPQKQKDISSLELHPLTPKHWTDLEKLFGPRGACGGCWCMWWRLPRSQFMKQRGDENRKALKNIVEAGEVPGILAYAENEPIGWCAVAPRESFSALGRSRILKRVDDKPVWSIVCFFVTKPYRGKGITIQLLKAAVDYVKKHGGKIVEGYPVDPKAKRIPAPFAYTGVVSMFRKVGFKEVLRRSETRPVMRYVIEEKAT
ncbi:MAG: GNAT family N-acetyltransferase [Candidatus Bathyarchaeia archaeon]|nr:GNAT family N-acetyltransferase [Candidatus Bathyarchaeota archaeon A05DMB-4]MDH7594819.1 GNAT family N-acetyltransferase [Candidatus Bathyarchaeota archaeon]